MEKVAYVILALVAIGWLIAIIIGLIAAFPVGLIGLVILFAIGLLFGKVLKERIERSSTDRYSRDVEK
jgi:Sec-independent protein secretion pathway component TatC